MTEHDEGPRSPGTEPLEEAVLETADALRRIIEDGQARGMWPEDIPILLHKQGYLEQEPLYVVVLAAMTEAGAEHVFGNLIQTGEDLLRNYVHEERMREVRRRRDISARRRRDFEERGLSAEESDRLARHFSSLSCAQGNPILAVPTSWEPPRITKEEAEEIYWEFRRRVNADYLRELEEWRQFSPEEKLRYPEPRPLVDHNREDRIYTLKMLLYKRQVERLRSVQSPEDLRAYEQEFLSASSP